MHFTLECNCTAAAATLRSSRKRRKTIFTRHEQCHASPTAPLPSKALPAQQRIYHRRPAAHSPDDIDEIVPEALLLSEPVLEASQPLQARALDLEQGDAVEAPPAVPHTEVAPAGLEHSDDEPMAAGAESGSDTDMDLLDSASDGLDHNVDSPVTTTSSQVYRPDLLDYDTGELKAFKIAFNRAAQCLVCWECHAVVPLDFLASHARSSRFTHSYTSHVSLTALAHAESILNAVGGCAAHELHSLDLHDSRLPLPGLPIEDVGVCCSVRRGHVTCDKCQTSWRQRRPAVGQPVPGPVRSQQYFVEVLRPPAFSPSPTPDNAPAVHARAAALTATALAASDPAPIFAHIAPVHVPPLEALHWTDLVAGLDADVRSLVRPPPSSTADQWFQILRKATVTAFRHLEHFVRQLEPSARDCLVAFDCATHSGTYSTRWKPLTKETSRDHYADALAELVHFAVHLVRLPPEHPLSAKITIPPLLRDAVAHLVETVGTPVPSLVGPRPPPGAGLPAAARQRPANSHDSHHFDNDDGDDDYDEAFGAAGDGLQCSKNEDELAAAEKLEARPSAARLPTPSHLVAAIQDVVRVLFLSGVDPDLRPAQYPERSCGDVVSAFVVFTQLHRSEQRSIGAKEVAMFAPLAQATPVIAKLKYTARLAVAAEVRHRFEPRDAADRSNAYDVSCAIKAAAEVLLSDQVPGPFHTITHWSRFLTTCISYTRPLPSFSTSHTDFRIVHFQKHKLDFAAAARCAVAASQDAAVKLADLLHQFDLSELPRHADVFDDVSETAAGYSALSGDSQISAVVDAAFSHVVDHLVVEGTQQLDLGLLERFLSKVDSLTEALMPIAYFAAAGAYRVTEFLSIALVNLQSTHRGVVYRDGRIQLVPWYSKNLAKAARGSPIPRPLPHFLAEVFHPFLAVVKPLAARVALLAQQEAQYDPARAQRYHLLAQAHLQSLWVTASLGPTSRSAGTALLRLTDTPVDVDRARCALARGLGALFGLDTVSARVFRQCNIGLLRTVLQNSGAMEDATRILHLEAEEGAAEDPAPSRPATLLADYAAGHSTKVADIHYAAQEDRLHSALFHSRPGFIMHSDWVKLVELTDAYHAALGWDTPQRGSKDVRPPSRQSASQSAVVQLLDRLQHQGTVAAEVFALVSQEQRRLSDRWNQLEGLIRSSWSARPPARAGERSLAGNPDDGLDNATVSVDDNDAVRGARDGRLVDLPPVVDVLPPLAALRSVFGPDASWRTPSQANLVPLLCSDAASTGAGKTNAVLIPALVRPERLTIFVVSTIALRESVLSSLRGAVDGIPGGPRPQAFVATWTTHTLASTCGIVLVWPEHADSPHFASWVHLVSDRATRAGDVHLAVDEPQLVHAHAKFRGALPNLFALLDTIGAPKTYLSATVPPSLEPVFLPAGPTRSVDVFRSPTTRLNLHVVVLAPPASDVDSRARLVDAVRAATFAGTNANDVRGIVYVSTQREVAALADAYATLTGEALPKSCYHGGEAEPVRTAAEQAWFSGSSSPIMFCTPHSFGTGVDRPNVRFTLHLGTALDSVINFAQEIGRAARRSQAERGFAIVVPSASRPSFLPPVSADDQAVHEYLVRSDAPCRLSVLASFLDGRPMHYPPLCDVEPGAARCDLCHRRQRDPDSSAILDSLLSRPHSSPGSAPLASAAACSSTIATSVTAGSLPTVIADGSTSGPRLKTFVQPATAAVLHQAVHAEGTRRLRQFVLSTDALAEAVYALVPDFRGQSGPANSCLPCALVHLNWQHPLGSNAAHSAGAAIAPYDWLALAKRRIEHELSWMMLRARSACARTPTLSNAQSHTGDQFVPFASDATLWSTDLQDGLAALEDVAPPPAPPNRTASTGLASAIRRLGAVPQLQAAAVVFAHGTTVCGADVYAGMAISALQRRRLPPRLQ
ncbi:hypothetical protein Rhopal_005678-T1 [Rhodotorula paludigena]|uniref:DNA 3'-5' helicase n=1 Tax=Rhodotorula paludigena TaxID=86838 RepID=A0AAV5GR22_9BASI|nr:hypothetical protein Rhopal_005678-T1 [Rhodotorula paludigena]